MRKIAIYFVASIAQSSYRCCIPFGYFVRLKVSKLSQKVLQKLQALASSLIVAKVRLGLSFLGVAYMAICTPVRFQNRSAARGVTFVEVLIASAVILLFFSGIIGGFHLAIKVIGHARAEAGALALAGERIEYLRSMPYGDAGTVGGIPTGLIAQNEAVTLNKVTYNRRTLIQYVDAPEDGEGDADENGITADYKRVKVELTWTVRGYTGSLALVTNLVPRGIESLEGGGTLRINVFDATATPVGAAEVHVINTLTSPAVDVVVYTNASGTAMFPGAPASGGYEIVATKAGYSTDRTYSATVANPNPNPPHVSVIEGGVSTVNFAIDRVSTLSVNTVGLTSSHGDEDTFEDQSRLAAMTDTVVENGALSLVSSSNLYVFSGTARSVPIDPAGLFAWGEVSWDAVTPSGTSVTVRLYTIDELGDATLVSDIDLPGNAAGFVTSPVSIAPLAAALYPRLAVEFRLANIDETQTPTVTSREITFEAADNTLPNIGFTLAGTKNIGTDNLGVPIRKYDAHHQTNSNGVVSLSGLEWDLYDVTLDAAEGYDIADACPGAPFVVEPDTETEATLVLVPASAHSLRVKVESSLGTAIEGAEVTLTNGGFTETLVSSACGYVHFSDLSADSEYALDISAPGYASGSASGITVGGATVEKVTLSET